MEDSTKKDDSDPTKWYRLVHPGGPGGFTREEPRPKPQDADALPGEGYVVAFFPKIGDYAVDIVLSPGDGEAP